jgi:hypothetical protein
MVSKEIERDDAFGAAVPNGDEIGRIAGCWLKMHETLLAAEAKHNLTVISNDGHDSRVLGAGVGSNGIKDVLEVFGMRYL